VVTAVGARLDDLMGPVTMPMITASTGPIARSVSIPISLPPQCGYCYDDGYQKDDKPSVAMASMPSYSLEAPWYSDTGATDHITNDLERLAIREKYQGKEQI
jgi:hypothetical protein